MGCRRYFSGNFVNLAHLFLNHVFNKPPEVYCKKNSNYLAKNGCAFFWVF
jgi:hypothetical protein